MYRCKNNQNLRNDIFIFKYEGSDENLIFNMNYFREKSDLNNEIRYCKNIFLFSTTFIADIFMAQFWNPLTKLILSCQNFSQKNENFSHKLLLLHKIYVRFESIKNKSWPLIIRLFYAFQFLIYWHYYLGRILEYDTTDFS